MYEYFSIDKGRIKSRLPTFSTRGRYMGRIHRRNDQASSSSFVCDVDLDLEIAVLYFDNANLVSTSLALLELA